MKKDDAQVVSTNLAAAIALAVEKPELQNINP